MSRDADAAGDAAGDPAGDAAAVPGRVRALYVVFALSGFCGLIYESIWSHYLKLFVGHAAYAQSLVLAVFMGGMGLGAWLAARYGSRIRNVLWAYAAAEAVVGVTALLFHAVFGGVIDWAYTSLLPATCGGEGLCASQWLLAAALILPQSVLLGTTFPWMSAGVLRLAPGLPGRQLALLYFLNSAGAVVGVLASGFVLIPLMGLPGALLTAGLGNIAVALAVYFIGKPVPADGEDEARAAAPPAPPLPAIPAALRPLLATLLSISLLTGLSSFIYEIAWIRMLSMVFGSATHSFEVMLAAFIAGLALGGLWIRKRIDRIPDVLRMLALVQIVMGLAALATLPLYAATFDAMGWLMASLQRSEGGYVLFTGAMVLLSLAVMLPATFCAGMTLPLITCELYRGASGERAIGWVYAANTVGAIAGVLLAVHLLLPQLSLAPALAVGAAIDIALGGWLLLARRRPVAAAVAAAPPRPSPLQQRWPLALCGVALVAAVVTPLLVRFDPLRMSAGVFREGRVRYPPSTEVTFAEDGKTATIHVVTMPDGGRSLITNGKSDGAVAMKPDKLATGDEVTTTLLAALPLLYKPQAAEVAVIGFGTGMTSATLLASPNLKRLDTVEIEPAVVRASQAFRPLVDRAYTDPRHHVVLDDAKSYFTRGQRRYDVIVSEPSNPWVSGVSSLFSEEFYARMRRHLKPDGLLVQWVQVYEISPMLVASIVKAMAQHFPVYEVWNGSAGDLLLVATTADRMPPRSPALWQMAALTPLLERAFVGREDLLALQYVGSQKSFAPLVNIYVTPPNSDYFPIVDLEGPRTRFLRASTSGWAQLHAGDVAFWRALDGTPRVAMSGESPAANRLTWRQQPYVRARQLAALIQHGELPPAANPIPDLNTALLLRQRLMQCQQGDARLLAATSWDAVVRLGAETIPFLAVPEASALWEALHRSPCVATVGEDERRWLDVLLHLARGDWAAAGAPAQALLAGKSVSSTLQRMVLLKTAATALIGAGDGAAARKLIDAQAALLPEGERDQPWLRALVAHALRAAAPSAR